jgi:hypothetical protein
VSTWFLSRPLGSAASLEGASTIAPSFQPDLAGDYSLTTRVTDSTGLWVEEVSVVTVGSCGAQAPEIDTITIPDPLVTNSMATLVIAAHDDDNDVCAVSPPQSLTIQSEIVAGVPGSATSRVSTHLSPTEGPTIGFFPTVKGDYTIRTTVSDDTGLTHTVDTLLRVYRAPSSEFVVNQTTAGLQLTSLEGPSGSQIAHTSSWVAVWFSTPALFGGDFDVIAQRFDDDRNFVGSEILVNENTTGPQTSPTIAAAADGSFVVSFLSADSGTSPPSVVARVFESNGEPRTGDITVNQTSSGEESEASVTMAPDGTFLVVWTCAFGCDTSESSIAYRVFAADGTPLTDELVANDRTQTNDQRHPSASAFSDGTFVIVWHSNGSDFDEYGIRGRLIAANGSALGSEFTINTTTAGSQMDPVVGTFDDGSESGFVVVFNDNGTSLRMRRFAQDGTASADDSLIYSSPARFTNIAVNAAGEFVVTWTEDGLDPDAEGVGAQAFDSFGVSMGPPFVVNDVVTSGTQAASSVGLTDDGEFFTVFLSDGNDGDSFGIGGRLLDIHALP